MAPTPTLRVSSLVALSLARLVINSARRFPYAILTAMARSMGVDRSVLETALSAQWATGIASPVVGPAIDRLGRRRAMLAGVGTLTLLAALAALGQSTAIILFALVASGVTKMLYDPAMQAYVGDRTPYHQRARALGVTELSWSGAFFIIGPLAAYLIAGPGVSAIFGVIAVGGALAFGLLLVFVPRDEPAPAMQPGAPRAQALLHAWTQLSSSRAALAMLLVAAVMSMAGESIGIVYEAWFSQTYGVDTATLGGLAWVIAAAEVVGEVGVILFADRLGKRRLGVVALLATGAMCILLPLTVNSLSLASAVLFALYFCFEVSIVVLIPLASEVLPQARGTMMSSNVAALAAGRAIGTLLGGRLFRLGGFGLNGLVALGLNVVAAFLIRRFVFERR